MADLTDYMSGSRDPIIDKMQHLASFLLIRGPYAWLGWAWLGCGNFPYRPKGTSCGKGFFFPVMEYWRAPSDILFCARLRFVLLLLFALFYFLDDTFLNRIGRGLWDSVGHVPPGEGRSRSVCAGIYQIVRSGGLQQVGGDGDNEEVEHHRCRIISVTIWKGRFEVFPS